MFQYEYILKRVSVTDILPNFKKKKKYGRRTHAISIFHGRFSVIYFVWVGLVSVP